LFFQNKGFLYIHTPILTASDCEGAGEQFLVTTMNVKNTPKLPSGEVDFAKDFFGKPAYSTVSGQLNAETIACALSDVYTFGPTFRAENSNTSRHLAEFWMIEPEMAFADLKDDMDCAESYIRFVVKYVLENCAEDLAFFDAFVEKGLVERLKLVAESEFARLTYTDAIKILEKSGKSFEFPYTWGSDLQSEHERYLAEEHCKKPVILTDYPKEIKAFYMRMNDDGKTVAAMDVLVPKIGELVGGSQREERPEVLREKIVAAGLNPEDYSWYLELRKYGTVPHAGFGAGFERLVQFVTGMENIRDVIPFPRYPGHAEF
jgi:asparaginyl-tRNA synthetase